MRKKIITCLFLITPFTFCWSSVLSPSEIETLRSEFDGLNNYQSETSYQVPAKQDSSTLSHSNKKTQFVDLDSVFEEDNSSQSAPSRRKRQ